MKGQYLAVESVAAFGLGLLVALGSISLFAGYKADIMGSVQEAQTNAISSKLVAAVYSLKETDSGTVSVELPETVAGTEYTIAFSDRIGIFTPGSEHTTRTGLGHRYEFSGSVKGGDVKIYKNGKQFNLRAD